MIGFSAQPSLVSASAHKSSAHREPPSAQVKIPNYKRTISSGRQVQYEVNNKYNDDLEYDKNPNLPIISYNYTTNPDFCPDIFNNFQNYSKKTTPPKPPKTTRDPPKNHANNPFYSPRRLPARRDCTPTNYI